MSKKMSMLRLSYFFRFLSLDFAVESSCFLPRTLIWSVPESPSHFSEVWPKFDPVSSPDPLRNRIKPDTRLKIKGSKKSTPPHGGVKFYTPSPNALIQWSTVSSRYYNYCTDDGTNPRNYECPQLDSYDASYQRCPPISRTGQQSCHRCPLRSSIVLQSHICRHVAILTALQVNLVTTELSVIGATFSVLWTAGARDCKLRRSV
jgi:hypothetical protein